MLRKFLVLLMALTVINAIQVNPVFAFSQDKDARFTEKVKKGISSLDTGEKAKIEVKLKDKTKLRGYVKTAGADSFTIVEAKTGAETEVMYSQVKQVMGKGLSTGSKIAIGIGIGVGALIALALFMVYVYGGD